MENESIRNEGLIEDEEIEIDLLQFLMELKRRFLLILVMTVVCGGLVGAFSRFALTPQYTSTAMMYILSKETTLTSLADLQIGSQLTKDYKVIVTSRPVLEDVVRTLKLDMNHKELRKKITIDNPSDTRILSVSAEDPDPAMAKRIADSVAITASEYIGDIMEMVPPKMIESGELPLEKSSPHNTRNAVLGAIAGFIAACMIVLFEMILNDTIRTEDDVVRYLRLTVLASIPKRLHEIAEDKEAMAKNKPASDGKKGKKLWKRKS